MQFVGQYASEPGYRAPDGSPQTLYKASGAVPGTASGTELHHNAALWKGQCITGGVSVTSPAGTRYDMTVDDGNYWNVSKITDRNGNTLTFTYQTIAGRAVVSTIASNDADPRNVSFTYANNMLS